MSFQLRHKEFGVFQGQVLGLGFWHPYSDQPEQGLCEFPTEAEAQELVEFLTSDACASPHDAADLTIERFDQELNECLLAQGQGTLMLWGKPVVVDPEVPSGTAVLGSQYFQGLPRLSAQDAKQLGLDLGKSTC